MTPGPRASCSPSKPAPCSCFISLNHDSFLFFSAGTFLIFSIPGLLISHLFAAFQIISSDVFFECSNFYQPCHFCVTHRLSCFVFQIFQTFHFEELVDREKKHLYLYALPPAPSADVFRGALRRSGSDPTLPSVAVPPWSSPVLDFDDLRTFGFV